MRFARFALLGGLLLTGRASGAATIGYFELLPCNTSTQDQGVPQSGQSAGAGFGIIRAMDDLAQDCSSVACGPCLSSGCTLKSAGNGASDVDAGQGGTEVFWYDGQTGMAVVGINWGTGGFINVTCTECEA
jgi:hypothetical protein